MRCKREPDEETFTLQFSYFFLRLLKLKCMKYLTIVLVLILSFIVCKQYDQINNLNSKISTLDYKVDNINKKQFYSTEYDNKESFYLTQLSNSTTLILSVIGFSLVLAGVSSFLIIKERFEIFDASTEQKVRDVRQEIEALKISTINVVDTFKTEVNSNIHNYEIEYKKLESIIYNLKNDFDYELVILKHNEAKEFFSRKDLSGYVFYSLYSSKYSVSCIKHYRNIQSNLSESMLDIMNNRLISVKLDLESLLIYNKTEKHKLPIKDKESIINLIKNINEVSDVKTFEILSSLFNVLDFIDLE